MNKNILMTEHERTLNEISLEGIKWREDRIVRLEEALRDLLDGDGDMTAARIAKARAALGSSSETPDEYRDEAVNRILAAKDGPNDPTAPTDPAKFIEWLHGPETKGDAGG